MIGIVENFQDITQRKKMERALSAERERLAVTLRSIGDGVVTTDISGKIVLMNKVAEILTGWEQSEAIGRPIEEVMTIVDERTKTAGVNPVSKVLQTGQLVGFPAHTALIAKDGSIRSIADSGAPIRNKNSEVIGVVVVFRDVTEKNRMEEELLKTKKLESVGVLAGGIAHDFNNILAAILGNISLALLDGNLQKKTRELLNHAEKASLRAKSLTHQLLTFSKGGEPIKETSSLEEVIEDSANFVLHGKTAACEFNFPENLWLVDIDKNQISQVIQNIIINATEAMPGGGTIRLSGENIEPIANHLHSLPEGQKYVRISIADQGTGISADVVDKIFDPYFSTKSKGSGLGLTICHSIVTKHSGKIEVASDSGKGTVFSIYLPTSSDNISITAQQRKPEKSGKARKMAKILIMDDEEIVREVTQEMLSYAGHRVSLAENGSEAIRLYKEAQAANDPFDLTIMDLTIPGGMGGMEAIKEILSINPEAKVIVSSGYSDDPVMASFKKYGFCEAIVKPYQLDDLLKTIDKVLA
ncbi:MAG: response regulator [Deltaproteobacteria bacterium]